MSASQHYPFFFTWSAQKSARPLAITRGEGSRFWTEEGDEWLDLAAMVYQANVGHGHPRMVEAITRQAASLCVTMPNAVFPAKIDAAERLLALAPEGFSRVFFTLGGAEANENAIKLARMVTGRHKLVSRYRSYHGASLGALSLTGDYRRPPFEPALSGVIHAMDCYCDRCPFGQVLGECHTECAAHIEQMLELEGPGTVAAVILEAIPGANGVLIPPADYWPRVRAACDKHGTLLVADEVLTGFGRTGRAFAFEHFDVVPDMISVSKAVTGGYAPMGALLVHERIAEHFDENVLLSGLTNYAHPLGVAAAAEAMAIYEEEDLFARAASMEPVLEDVLGPLRRHAAVDFVRIIGLFAAIECALDKELFARLQEAVEARHLLLHFRSDTRTVLISPPLNIEEDVLRHGMALFVEALAEVTGV